MIRNYFVIAWRQLRHNPLFSFINMLGLSSGLSAALVIFLIASHEYGFDHFEQDRDRLYRVVVMGKIGVDSFPMTSVPEALRAATEKSIPGIETTMGLIAYGPSTATISKLSNRLTFDENVRTCFTDPSYFQILGMTWLAGNARSALSDPGQVVLTRTQAERYFPTATPAGCLGKLITYDDTITVQVSGVVTAPAGLTDFWFTDFLSTNTYTVAYPNKWDGYGSWDNFTRGDQCWLKLSRTAVPGAIEKALNGLMAKNDPSNKNGSTGYRLQLQPLADLHFNADFFPYPGSASSKMLISGLFAIAGFLLLLACINFINLTTAISARRAKEIGIRKAMGGSRATLILQFMQETLMVVFLATTVSLLLVPVWLSLFSAYIPTGVAFQPFHQPEMLLFTPGLIFIITLLAGAYPAILAAGYLPVTMLKNRVAVNRIGGNQGLVRKGLTVFQFVIAQAFIIATLVMVKQISFMINTDRGFRKEAVITAYIPGSSGAAQPGTDTKKIVFAERIRSLPFVERVSLGSWEPSISNGSTSLFTFRDGKTLIRKTAENIIGDPEYLPLYHLRLLAGRNVLASDSSKEYLINETFARQLGFRNPGASLGTTLDGKPVVGVIKDFLPGTMQRATHAIALTANTKSAYVANIALVFQPGGGRSMSALADRIGKMYHDIYPDREWNFHFVDQEIASYFESEQKMARLLKWATGLSVFISCLGLLGLVIYTSGAKKKEIGIRKVLGASVSSVIALLTGEFLRLVLIGFAIAVPASWWLMHRWLENYAYRTSIDWWVFALSGAGMGMMALLTLAGQTYRAAAENPVKSLRAQ